ncbi:hypothetical protein DP42_5380 [Burkholderia pseudomallei]|nr:hypothetical protein DP42_5380 [Burkholderia pseudomallei]
MRRAAARNTPDRSIVALGVRRERASAFRAVGGSGAAANRRRRSVAGRARYAASPRQRTHAAAISFASAMHDSGADPSALLFTVMSTGWPAST